MGYGWVVFASMLCQLGVTWLVWRLGRTIGRAWASLVITLGLVLQLAKRGATLFMFLHLGVRETTGWQEGITLGAYILLLFGVWRFQAIIVETFRNSDRKFRDLTENTSDWIWEVDDRLRYVYVSPRIVQFLGYAPEEVLGKTPFDLMTPDESEFLRPRMEALLAHPAPFVGLSNRNRHRDGSVRLLETSGVPIFDRNGRFKGYRGIDRDITELRGMDEALRTSQEKLKLLLDSTGEAIYGVDLEGCCTFCNPACLRLLGFREPQDLLGRNMHDLIHHTRPDGRPMAIEDCLINRACREGESTHVDDEIYWRADGSSFPVEYWSHPQRTGDRVVGGVVAFVDITERKKAEAEIRRLGQFLESVIRHADVWLNVLDTHANVVLWNQAAERISGYRQAEVQGHGLIWEWLYPDPEYRERITQKVGEILGKGEVVEGFETIIRTKSGEPRTISWNSRALQDDRGSVSGSIAIGRDVTDAKLSDEALRRSEEKYRTVSEQLMEGLATTDASMHYIYCNPAFASMLGYRIEEILGKTPLDLVYEPDLELARRKLQHRPKGESEKYELRMKRKDGSPLEVLLSATPLRSDIGEFLGVLGLVTDITKHKRIEAELQESREKLRLVLDGVSDPIFSIDTQGRYLFVNVPFATPFGKRPEQIIGITMWDLFSKDEADQRFKALSRVLESGEPYTFEVKVDSVDKGVRYYITSITPRKDETGRVHGVLCTSKEITERKQAEDALRQAQKIESLGLMAGGIAHDFNNLFQAIQGNLEVARESLTDPLKAQASLDRALRIVEKSAVLSQQMLDYSGKSFRRSESIDLGALIQARGDVLKRQVPEPVELQLRLQEGLPPIEGDSDQLLQVLMGLLANAVEASAGNPGRIEISVEAMWVGDRERAMGFWAELPPVSKLVCLAVTDEGNGIPQEALGRIFDPFFSTKAAGRGLGLSAALGIIRGHKAGLQVLSAPDKGTSVRICFPPGAAWEESAGPKASPGGGMAESATVLLVDDDEDLRVSLSEILRELLGYNVLEAKDGQEAVELFRQKGEAIAVILMDATMPRLTGSEAFEAIKRLRPDAKAILCSGYSEDTGNETARRHGFLGFLKKPFSIKVLKETLDKALGR